MTRKDFELIAKALRGSVSEADKSTYVYDQVVMALAAAMATTNPRYDQERFVEACYREVTIRERG